MASSVPSTVAKIIETTARRIESQNAEVRPGTLLHWRYQSNVKPFQVKLTSWSPVTTLLKLKMIITAMGKTRYAMTSHENAGNANRPQRRRRTPPRSRSRLTPQRSMAPWSRRSSYVVLDRSRTEYSRVGPDADQGHGEQYH